MANTSVSKKEHRICIQCGSPLVFVSQEVVQPEGTRYPQVNTVYLCSNVDCQEKQDKEKAARLKIQQNRAVTEKERMERIQEKRRSNKKAELETHS